MRQIQLSHLPTPLFHNSALDRLVGTEVWVKLDDTNSGAASGNKIRKLEFLLADALAKGATHIITCGGEQSNHARATALAATRTGLKTLLFLRTSNPEQAPPNVGNLFLNRMLGAEIRFITAAQYGKRDLLMHQAELELNQAGQHAYVIPEGGSNGLGALGWVQAMQEVRQQLDLGLARGVDSFQAVVHACGSGGTAAGCVVGSGTYGVADEVIAMAVCDNAQIFIDRIQTIIRETVSLETALIRHARLTVLDAWKGPAYGVASEEQLRFIVEVARCSGLILDPVYTGKALFGLARMNPKPKRALFLHTGGLQGLLAQCADFEAILCPERVKLRDS